MSLHDDPERLAIAAGYLSGALPELTGVHPETVLRALTEAMTLRDSLARHPEADASDEHHTMDELYEYRMLYNAHAAHGWVSAGVPVVKSWLHSDGELCFGGGWFIVVATLPSGQVSNHYAAEHWDLFDVPEANRPPEYDGHTPEVAAKRLRDGLMAPTQLQVQAPVGDSPQVGEECKPAPVDLQSADSNASEVATVSDGERDGLERVIANSLEFLASEDAEALAENILAAGYRKAPVVNVEDVARAIAPWLSTTLQDPDDWQMTRARDIATAIKAHLLDGGA